MEQTEKVTVIIPAYNAEKSIAKAVSSVLQQKKVNIELIVVDDGSTDSTRQICQEIARDESRLKVYSISNHGVSYARNYGLSRATGEYIGFVDSDDWVDSEMFCTLLGLLHDNQAQLATCALINEPYEANEDNRNRVRIIENSELYGEVYYSKEVGGYLCNKLFVRKYITEYLREDLAQCEDFIFVLCYLNNICKMACTSMGLYHYVRQNAVNRFSYSKRSLTLMPAYEEILRIYTDHAPMYVPAIRLHLLKTYLNFRARYLIIHDKNKDLKKQIVHGVTQYFMPVIRDEKVRLKEKCNVLLSFILPRTMLKAKNRVLYKQREKGIW